MQVCLQLNAGPNIHADFASSDNVWDVVTRECGDTKVGAIYFGDEAVSNEITFADIEADEDATLQVVIRASRPIQSCTYENFDVSDILASTFNYKVPSSERHAIYNIPSKPIVYQASKPIVFCLSNGEDADFLRVVYFEEMVIHKMVVYLPDKQKEFLTSLKTKIIDIVQESPDMCNNVAPRDQLERRFKFPYNPEYDLVTVRIRPDTEILWDTLDESAENHTACTLDIQKGSRVMVWVKVDRIWRRKAICGDEYGATFYATKILIAPNNLVKAKKTMKRNIGQI